MSIMDKVAALLPWRRERHDLAARTERVELPERGGQALRDDLDRWLERLVEEPLGWRGSTSFAPMPHIEVHESDDEVVVMVEVPGVNRDDLDLTITSEGLVVRGEMRDEREDERRDYRLAQSRYRAFVRAVPLPPGLDLDGAKASLRNGVLTVRFAKVDTRPGMRRVPVR
jgi:HSP20 family protein